MRIEFAVDWLNYTCDRHSQLGWYNVAMRFPNEHWQAIKGMHGYTMGAINSATARVLVNPDRPEMGQHVMYSGACLNAYRNEGISARAIIKHHALFGDMCKRVDLALDVYDAKLDIGGMFVLLDEGSATTRAKHWNLIKGNDGGATLYVGSRTSEIMLRVYDKAAETGQAGDWKRVELELKGSRAIEVSRMMSVGNDQQAVETARGIIKALVDFKTAQWAEITGNSEVVIAKAKDNTPDTELWIMTQVATAMARLIKKQGNDKLMGKFTRKVEQLVRDLQDNELE